MDSSYTVFPHYNADHYIAMRDIMGSLSASQQSLWLIADGSEIHKNTASYARIDLRHA